MFWDTLGHPNLPWVQSLWSAVKKLHFFVTQFSNMYSIISNTSSRKSIDIAMRYFGSSKLSLSSELAIYIHDISFVSSLKASICIQSYPLHIPILLAILIVLLLQPATLLKASFLSPDLNDSLDVSYFKTWTIFVYHPEDVMELIEYISKLWLTKNRFFRSCWSDVPNLKTV